LAWSSSVHNPASIRACPSFWNLGRLACLHLGDDAIKSSRAKRSQHTAELATVISVASARCFCTDYFFDLFLDKPCAGCIDKNAS
jgi:hypothetical protein